MSDTLTNAQILEFLMELRPPDVGVLHPWDVVAAARDPMSPLHGRFQWDDTIAAHQHRLFQARQLIESVCIGVAPEEDDKGTQEAAKNAGQD